MYILYNKWLMGKNWFSMERFYMHDLFFDVCVACGFEYRRFFSLEFSSLLCKQGIYVWQFYKIFIISYFDKIFMNTTYKYISNRLYVSSISWNENLNYLVLMFTVHCCHAHQLFVNILFHNAHRLIWMIMR